MNGSILPILMITICATMHFSVMCVLALYARHQVKYLSLAWIMGIFTCMHLLWGIHYYYNGIPDLGILHPGLLGALLVVTFLQSIFPLSIPMPGYLQWGRMWRYASPAIVILGLYLLGLLVGSRPVIIRTGSELVRHFLSGDIWFRMAMLAVSIYYIINIFRLPRLLTHVPFPRYLIGYSTVLGMSAIFYVVMTVVCTLQFMLIYLCVFTVLNLYLCFRTLETMALALPKPVIEEVEEEPTEEAVEKADKEDFNEANQKRFARMQYWMQKHIEEWTDNTFNRDRLCEATGYNRHLILQCIRSQGFNNVHDYINSYRVEELKRRVRKGQITTVAECQDVGFGTTKTARTCFERHEGCSLDDFLATYSK